MSVVAGIIGPVLLLARVLVRRKNESQTKMSLAFLIVLGAAIAFRATAVINVLTSGFIGAFAASLLVLLGCMVKDAFTGAMQETKAAKEAERNSITQTEEDRLRLIEMGRVQHDAVKASDFDAYEDGIAKYNNHTGFNKDDEPRIAQHIKEHTQWSIAEDQELLELYTDTYKKHYNSRWQYYADYYASVGKTAQE
jgi:hypothetical protein